MNTVTSSPSLPSNIDESEIRIAEHESPWSDSYKPIQVSFASPKTALQSLIVFSLLVEEEVWENDSMMRHLGQMCFKYKYEGKWKILQDYLEKITNFQEFEKKYIEDFGPHDYYGNFLPSRQRWKKTRLEKIQEVGLDRDRVKKKVYRRGYDDKGTLRPPHRPNLPGGEKVEREDRRQKIIHPLLHGESLIEKIQEAAKPVTTFVEEVRKE